MVFFQPPAANINKATVPTNILKQYQQIIMAGDIMYINKVPFFMSISWHLHFGTAQHLMNQKGTTILQSIKQIQQVYLQGGYKLTRLLMDGQFEPLQANLAAMGIELKVMSMYQKLSDISEQSKKGFEPYGVLFCLPRCHGS